MFNNTHKIITRIANVMLLNSCHISIKWNFVNTTIKNGQIKVVEVGGLDPREHEQADAYITKAFIQTRDGDRELTDEEYEYINEPFSVNDRNQQNILSDFLHRAAEEEVINYRAGQEDAEEDDDTVVARQGRGTTAAQFKAADDTEFG